MFIKRALSHIISLAWYAFSVFLAWEMYESFDQNQHERRYNVIFSHVSFDVVLLILTCIFSFFWNNFQSFLTYYSLTPLVRLVLQRHYSSLSYKQYSFKNIVLTTLVGVWALRTFAQKYRKWRGFPDQDPVYKQSEKCYTGFKRIFLWTFQLPFTAILNGLVSTLITLPLSIFYTRDQIKIRNGEDWSISELVAYGLIIFGLAVQAIADLERNEWENAGNENKVCDKGLRRYLRYPEYYGELVFWLGVWSASVASFEDVLVTNYVYWPIGWVLLALTILIVKLPKLEKLHSSLKGWSEYKRKVRFGLIPFFRI